MPNSRVVCRHGWNHGRGVSEFMTGRPVLVVQDVQSVDLLIYSWSFLLFAFLLPCFSVYVHPYPGGNVLIETLEATRKGNMFYKMPGNRTSYPNPQLTIYKTCLNGEVG